MFKKMISVVFAFIIFGQALSAQANWEGTEVTGTVFSLDIPGQLDWPDPVATISLTDVEFVREFTNTTTSADFTENMLVLTYENTSPWPNITYSPQTYTFELQGAIISDVSLVNSTFSNVIVSFFTSNSITIEVPIQNTNPGDIFTATFTIAHGNSGTGTETDPYIITDVYQLQSMQDDLSASYVLGNDIDASETSDWNNGEGFKPIGDCTVPCDTANDHIFEGDFDGKGHKISGLYINRPSTDFVGLFGIVENSDINNVLLEGAYIVGRQWVGGIVGNMSYSAINNCMFDGTIVGPYIAGGLVGRNFVGSISNSASKGEVTGAEGSGRFLGGLVGANNGHSVYGRSYITNCYSTSNVSSRHMQVGGLVGSNSQGNVTYSYAAGQVSCLDNDCDQIGGLIGENRFSSCLSSYWDLETSGQLGSAAGEGKSTAEMKEQATFIDWDFNEFWSIYENITYPFLNSFAEPVQNEFPQADAGIDQIVFEEITLDASGSNDPDGYIETYEWEIVRREDGFVIFANGKTATVSDLESGFYDVMLLITDNDGSSSSDQMLFAAIGQKPPCKFTIDDVNQARKDGYIAGHDKGYKQGFSAGFAEGMESGKSIFDTKTRTLSIPFVLSGDKDHKVQMRQLGKSMLFKVTDGFEAFQMKQKKGWRDFFYKR